MKKHFTIDNNYSDFRDHKLSLNPPDFKLLVNEIRRAEKIMGSKIKEPTNNEKLNEESARRSICVNENIDSGQIIKKNDLTWVRPGNGFRPGEENLVVGKKLTKSLEKGSIIKKENIK